MSGKRSLVRRVLFACVAVAVGLLVLEGGLRLLGYRPLPTAPVTRNREILHQYTKFRPSPTLTWELTPGWQGREGGGEVRINSMGLREREMSRPKPEGMRRILVLGDSVAFGHWVEAEQAFPRRLELALAPHLPGSVQVINAGVPGYSTFQQLTWLEETGWSMEPDIVVVAFVLNDVVERYLTMAAYGGAHTVLGVDTTAGMSRVSRILRRTAFHRFVTGLMRDQARRREVYSVRRLFESPLTPEVEAAWQLTETELAGIARASAERNVPLWLVAFPFRFQVAERLRPLPQERLQAWAGSAQVEFVDVTPSLARLGPAEAFLDHDHPTPRGHQAAAGAVAAAMLARRPDVLFNADGREVERVP